MVDADIPDFGISGDAAFGGTIDGNPVQRVAGIVRINVNSEVAGYARYAKRDSRRSRADSGAAYVIFQIVVCRSGIGADQNVVQTACGIKSSAESVGDSR